MKHSQDSLVSEPERASSARELSRLPELLAPAGDWECARAAVENGADAIYFGLERFNARMRANNFTEADLPKLMEFLHRRGVKGYVTFNILVFENEMAEAEQYLRTMIAAGVDAAIVQDVGMCRLIRQLSPDFPIHVSTQMTITSAAGVEFARELGCNLVVLARECSLKEIAALTGADTGSPAGVGALRSTLHAPRLSLHAPLPIEVFIHGALCVAYSGQCLTSEALGGRSANRGECAQACRMPYDLIADGKPVPLGARKYLLSPQDLAGLDVLPELVRARVASLKIEGRLKSPEYVANITRIYRQALDELLGSSGADAVVGQAVQPAGSRGFPAPLAGSGDWKVASTGRQECLPYARGVAAGETPTPLGASALMHSTHDTANSRYAMEMAFSRGLYTGWFGGTNNQQLVHARFGKKRGVYLGEVRQVEGERVAVRLQGPLKPGDGVVFDAGRPEEPEEGGRVYEIRSERVPARSLKDRNGGREARGTGGTPVLLSFGTGDIDFRRVHAGDRLWKTSDPELERRLRQSFEGDAPRFQRAVTMEVHGMVGGPLTLIARDELGHVVRLDSAMPLARAEKQPLVTERLRDQLGRLGGTPFRLGEMSNRLSGEVMLPVSELNRLRREAMSGLEAQRAQPKRWTLYPVAAGILPAVEPGILPCRVEHPTTIPGGKMLPSTAGRMPAATAHLIVLVRTMPQFEAALRCGVETVYCEFEDTKKYREAVARFRSFAPHERRGELFVAPPRIFKMGEEWTLAQVRSCDADGYLVRNYDQLEYFSKDRRLGDYSLNIANRLTAEYFKDKFGLERVTASYDLNFLQLEALLQAAPPEWFEVTIHQHIPMFHMEHCVFCAFLSSGTDYTNCGRPCDKHDLRLRDRVGMEHPVKADVGCRNTVFNALAQTGAEYVSRMLALGVRHFRLEFLNEGPGQVEQTIGKYRQLLLGEITGAELWRELKLLNQLGVTRGQIGGQRTS